MPQHILLSPPGAPPVYADEGVDALTRGFISDPRHGLGFIQPTLIVNIDALKAKYPNRSDWIRALMADINTTIGQHAALDQRTIPAVFAERPGERAIDLQAMLLPLFDTDGKRAGHVLFTNDNSRWQDRYHLIADVMSDDILETLPLMTCVPYVLIHEWGHQYTTINELRSLPGQRRQSYIGHSYSVFGDALDKENLSDGATFEAIQERTQLVGETSSERNAINILAHLGCTPASVRQIANEVTQIRTLSSVAGHSPVSYYSGYAISRDDVNLHSLDDIDALVDAHKEIMRIAHDKLDMLKEYRRFSKAERTVFRLPEGLMEAFEVYSLVAPVADHMSSEERFKQSPTIRYALAKYLFSHTPLGDEGSYSKGILEDYIAGMATFYPGVKRFVDAPDQSRARPDEISRQAIDHRAFLLRSKIQSNMIVDNQLFETDIARACAEGLENIILEGMVDKTRRKYWRDAVLRYKTKTFVPEKLLMPGNKVVYPGLAQG